MRWATTTHHLIGDRLIALTSDSTSEPDLLIPLISHPTLSHLPSLVRQSSVTLVIKNQFMKVTNLQLAWDEGIQEVFAKTNSQSGDKELIDTWNSQKFHINSLHKEGKMSMIPGDLATPIVTAMEEQDDFCIEEDRSDVSTSDGDNDDMNHGLVDGLDLEDISSAVDPQTLFI